MIVDREVQRRQWYADLDRAKMEDDFPAILEALEHIASMQSEDSREAHMCYAWQVVLENKPLTYDYLVSLNADEVQEIQTMINRIKSVKNSSDMPTLVWDKYLTILKEAGKSTFYDIKGTLKYYRNRNGILSAPHAQTGLPLMITIDIILAIVGIAFRFFIGAGNPFDLGNVILYACLLVAVLSLVIAIVVKQHFSKLVPLTTIEGTVEGQAAILKVFQGAFGLKSKAKGSKGIIPFEDLHSYKLVLNDKSVEGLQLYKDSNSFIEFKALDGHKLEAILEYLPVNIKMQQSDSPSEENNDEERLVDNDT